MKPVIITIIIQALWKLGRSALKDVLTWNAGIFVLALYFINVNEIALMLGASLAVTCVRNFNLLKKPNSLPSLFFPLFIGTIAAETIPKT